MRQGAAEAEGGTEGGREGGEGEVHEEHEGDGHELFMNVSMKGSKKEAGRASEGMAAASSRLCSSCSSPGSPAAKTSRLCFSSSSSSSSVCHYLLPLSLHSAQKPQHTT